MAIWEDDYEAHRLLKRFHLPDTAPGAPGQLYNLETDPGEMKNLYFEHFEIVEEIAASRILQKRTQRPAPGTN